MEDRGPESSLFNEKRLMRKEVLSRRDAISEELRNAKDRAIGERLAELTEFHTSRTILFYASFRSEVDTLTLLRQSLAEGKRAVLPKVDRASGLLALYEIKSMEELVPGYLGIPEPQLSEERSVDIAAVDVVIVPGVAFDGQGNRLGYGKGFYDKLLCRTAARTVALAYEEQMVERILSEDHDMKMDIIVTDRRILRFDGRKKN